MLSVVEWWRFRDPVHLEPLAAAADARVLRWAPRSEAGLIVMTLAYSGLRWGELVALRRRRCLLLERRLEVAQNSVEIGNEIVFGTPKNHERRKIAIPAFLADDLARHLAANVSADPDALVFSNMPARGKPGGPLSHRAFNRPVWQKAVRAAGLNVGLRLHDLRHTCASVLIGDGANVVQVQKQLGHKDAAITLRVYSHMWPDDLDRVGSILEDAHARAALRRDRDGTDAVVGMESRRSGG